MSWLEELTKAKFKGVDIYVDASEFERGRRVPVRELAGQDESRQQDLGRATDTIVITCFYWGANMRAQRDKLEAALLKEGAGTLQLPTRPELNARMTGKFVTTETRGELAYCTIRFSVVIEPASGGAAAAKAAGKAGGLKSKTDTAVKLKSAAKKTQEVASTDLKKKTNVLGLPSKAIKSTVRAITEVTDTLKTVQRNIQATLAVGDDISAQIATLDAVVNSILGTPSALATKMTSVILGVFGIAATVERNLDRATGLILDGGTPFEKSAPARALIQGVKSFALLGATATTSTGISVGKGSVGPEAATRVDAVGTSSASLAASAASNSSATGSSGSSGSIGSTTVELQQRTGLTVADQEAVNTRAVYQDARALAVGAAAEIFATASFDSSTLALGALEVMSSAIDDIQDYSGSDSLFDALADLRSALSQHLTVVASELPSSATYSPVAIVTNADERKGATITVGQSADPLDTVTAIRGGGTRLGLPRVVSYAPPMEVPALLIAHTFYGDAELADDIVARNSTRYPLFISDPIELIEP